MLTLLIPKLILKLISKLISRPFLLTTITASTFFYINSGSELKAQPSLSDLNFMVGGFYSMSASKGEGVLNSNISTGSG
ncbi:MAG: hypothetical protein HQK51_03650 [Oligoflexia bacterium]|nr:hypothetical protein [Oligoflexia bacterium]